jgi:hypothetical protein
MFTNAAGRLAINVVVFMWPIKVALIGVVLLMMFSEFVQISAAKNEADRAAFFATGGVQYSRSNCEIGKTVILCKETK